MLPLRQQSAPHADEILHLGTVWTELPRRRGAWRLPATHLVGALRSCQVQAKVFRSRHRKKIAWRKGNPAWSNLNVIRNLLISYGLTKNTTCCCSCNSVIVLITFLSLNSTWCYYNNTVEVSYLYSSKN